ncbi:MAG: hypothetical protein ACTSWY_15110 [Promethearchaeota archaeon]
MGKMNTEWLNKYGWAVLGIILVPINLVCLIGSGITRNPYEILWISHYSGLLGAIVLIFRFKKPFLNGMYLFLFILQLGSVITHSIDVCISPIFVDYLDIFYWLNHLPHLLGFYILAKKEFNINGVHIGFIFLLFLTNLTSQILYFNSEEALGINTVFRSYHIYVMLLAMGWYILLLLFYFNKNKKITSK